MGIATKLRLALPAVLAGSFLLGTCSARAQEPPGIADAIAGISSVPATHTAFTFDRDMLAAILGEKPVAALNGVTVESYRYHEPAFYIPENMAALRADFSAAGWTHLVEASKNPRTSSEPVKPITDMWFHFNGTDIDGLTVLIRAPREMSVVEVSGLLRPIDLLHLGGHFGIPKVDPSAVMVPAPPGR
jgi:hypothetical protein